MESLSKVLLMLFLFYIPNAFAYQECPSQFRNITRVCEDSYRTVGFCCDYHPEENHYHDCCFYTPVWGLWYFWCGLVVFLLLICGCVGACYKTKKSSTTKRTSPQSSNETELGTVNDGASFDNQDSLREKLGSGPPSYDELTAQGISAQFVEYSTYGNSDNTQPRSTEMQPSQCVTSTNETASS